MGLGEAGEGRNITHQQKKLNEEELREFRTRFNIPINDDQIAETPFYRPSDDSPEIQYLQERRHSLGGYVPQRRVRAKPIVADHDELFAEFAAGSDGREVSTTMAFVMMLRKMLRDPEIGKLIVPIVPDEARTFGMESLFRLVGIYNSRGQLYEPVDVHTLLYYKEAKDGQILEEGITEAGSMASFHRRGYGLFHPRYQYDSIFYLLLDVRLPAHCRPHLGRCGHALSRVPVRRYFRPHHSGRRGSAASGRQ